MKKLTILLSLIILFSCTKKVGSDPNLAYGDRALYDSTQNKNYKYYKNKDSLLSGTHGPHGNFKLRFNSIAFQMLTDNGKLPQNGKFPEGSFIVKDVYKNGTLDIYAFMYKRNGSWLWGEVHHDGKFAYTNKDAPISCVPCHSQAGNRDLVTSFNFY